MKTTQLAAPIMDNATMEDVNQVPATSRARADKQKWARLLTLIKFKTLTDHKFIITEDHPETKIKKATFYHLQQRPRKAWIQNNQSTM